MVCVCLYVGVPVCVCACVKEGLIAVPSSSPEGAELLLDMSCKCNSYFINSVM